MALNTLAEALRGIPPTALLVGADHPLLDLWRAQAREKVAEEERAARRRLERAQLGGCPCGEVAGEARCPWCDGGLPAGLRSLGDQAARARGLQEALAAIAPSPRPRAESPGATRPPNRAERRRARSRRWRG